MRRFLLLGVPGALLIASCGQAPTVTTGEATPLGLGALSLNGEIHPKGIYTTYHFEYGPTPSFGFKTRERPLPPRLAAHYRETWDEGSGGWSSWAQEHIHHPEGGASGGYIEWRQPAANNDFNHMAADVLHLVKFLRTGLLPQWRQEGNATLGGSDPDLRDARVSIWVRGDGWKPRGSELTWWLQSQSNPGMGNQVGWRRANWAYSGTTLTDELLDGEWHHVVYRLENDTNKWNYGGKNIGQGRASQRYEYWSIDQALGHNNNNFFHLLSFIDPQNLPVGAIHFDEFELTYRNESLLLVSNGGRLIRWPDSGNDDPSTLTDGWRHGEGKMWRSGPDPSEPLEFVYEFQDPVTIETIQVHQNSEWPSRDLEISVSTDGDAFTPISRLALPEKGEPNANFAFTVETGLSVHAGFLKVRVLSGYRSRHWGLGEIEVFGKGARMLPDDDLYHVNQDVWDLRPGATIHYRVVATGAEGVARGETRSFTLSPDRRPHVRALEPLRSTPATARLQGRLSPMGLLTYYHFEYGADPGLGSRTPLRYAGAEITPRSVFADLDGLPPKTRTHYRLVGINADGVVRSETVSLLTR